MVAMRIEPPPGVGAAVWLALVVRTAIGASLAADTPSLPVDGADNLAAPRKAYPTRSSAAAGTSRRPAARTEALNSASSF
jgi:hypothetical protein